MDMKKILAIAVIVLALFSCMSVASAGLFDFLGGETEVANATYTFTGFTFDLPENATIYNYTYTEEGYQVDTYMASWGDSQEGTYGTVTVTAMSGEYLVDTVDDYVNNLVDDGAKSEGKYGDWAILNVNGMPVSETSNSTSSGYILAHHAGDVLVALSGDNLTQLQSIADTFKNV